MQGRMIEIVKDAARRHERWVDDWGLQTGKLGPLDELIAELEDCLEEARRSKTAAEEGDD